MEYRKGNRFDIVMNHKEAKEYVQENGYDAFMEEVDKGFNYRICGASDAWEKDRKYICKMKGVTGDVIIGWEENENDF